MPAPPPPPPPPPMPGGGGPPPPPPPPPGGSMPQRPPANVAKGRGALLGDIQSGARLKKVGQVNDRSAPIIDKGKETAAAPAGAPPIPGGLRPPGGAGSANRARSNSEQPAAGGMDSAPQHLGGLFAGGMPKLKSRGGGVNMYDSDPETTKSRNAATPSPPPPRPMGRPPPRPGAVPPPLPPSAAPAIPSVAALRNNLRPSSAHTNSTPDFSTHHKPKTPPPIGKKPPMPPPTARKPSGMTSASMANLHLPSKPPPPRPALSHAPSGAPPPPPAPASRAAPSPPGNPPAAPSPLQSRISSVNDEDNEYDPYKYNSTPPAPPPPPPQSNGHKEPNLAAMAARNAFGMSRPSQTSPATPPPPPPSGPPPQASISQVSHPSSAPPPPPPPPGRPASSHGHAPPPPPPPPQQRSSGGIPTADGAPVGGLARMPDASSYTLTSNGSSGTRSRGDSGARSGTGGGGGRFTVQDSRWKFQGDEQLPKPRGFLGGGRRFRAGRGSSVPLDLSAFT